MEAKVRSARVALCEVKDTVTSRAVGIRPELIFERVRSGIEELCSHALLLLASCSHQCALSRIVPQRNGADQHGQRQEPRCLDVEPLSRTPRVLMVPDGGAIRPGARDEAHEFPFRHPGGIPCRSGAQVLNHDVNRVPIPYPSKSPSSKKSSGASASVERMRFHARACSRNHDCDHTCGPNAPPPVKHASSDVQAQCDSLSVSFSVTRSWALDFPLKAAGMLCSSPLSPRPWWRHSSTSQAS